MKKYFAILLMAFVGIAATSCDSREEVIVDNTVKNVVYDLKNITFTSANNYSYYSAFNRPMLDSDYAIVYRKIDQLNNGASVWEPIPDTVYLSDNREIEYDYDWSSQDISIYLEGNYEFSTTPEYSSNQTFRVVLIPGEYGKSAVANANKLSYEEVVKKYNIDDSKVGTL